MTKGGKQNQKNPNAMKKPWKKDNGKIQTRWGGIRWIIDYYEYGYSIDDMGVAINPIHHKSFFFVFQILFPSLV